MDQAVLQGQQNATASPPNPRTTEDKIAVVGLGYVGLPLAVSMARKFSTVIGFDISASRIAALRNGIDVTNEVEPEKLAASTCTFTASPEALAKATAYIVTVPTPIDRNMKPDLGYLRSACDLISKSLAKGDLVIFESTVYPGVTEDVCGKLLGELTGLSPSVDFSLGYSPERINPGDKVNTLEKIMKVVSADSPKALERVVNIYSRIIEAGLHQCSSIKVAEGAKALENTQRDINIALMNEIAMICDRVGISTQEMIEAASTKWNFIPFKPGLVGGHCIGVDPYYLAALSEQMGHHPEVILAGRRLNDSMATEVAAKTLKLLVRRGGSIRQARIGLFGVAFKENVPDLRNSKAVSLAKELGTFGLDVMISDSFVEPEDARSEGIKLSDPDTLWNLDVMIVASAHTEYREDPTFLNRLAPDGILIDIQGVFRSKDLPEQMTYWSL
ncbi:nucleotide sugar dehydrogenase [Aliiroseovarius sp. KMU-71]|uniref:nucleotide sugar dehydrogenase n=1 Tax=Aliiroseovarius sp. KMU-71 TaxID=3453123 RepID=UPI003F45978B